MLLCYARCAPLVVIFCGRTLNYDAGATSFIGSAASRRSSMPLTVVRPELAASGRKTLAHFFFGKPAPQKRPRAAHGQGQAPASSG